MSVRDDAAELIASSETFLGQGIATSTAAVTSLSAASDTVHALRDQITESMATCNRLLGSGHGGMGGIGASANAAAQKASEVIVSIQNTIGMILDLDHAITTHSSTMRQVGHAILSGGS